MTDSKRDDLLAAAEAVLFTANDPVSAEDLVKILNLDNEDEVTVIIEELQKRYAGPDRGISLQKVAGGYRFATIPQVESYVLDLLQRTSATRLSQAALEVLAIVGYRQPITLPEINAIRGVNSAGVIETLLSRHLIRTSGRKQVLGRPFLYRTTKAFLIHFGLDSLDDLPPIQEGETDGDEDAAE